MRVVIQLVRRARVTVAGECVAEIGRGLLIFLGIAKGDTQAGADYLAKKTIALRVFAAANDEEKPGSGSSGRKMTRSLSQAGGSVLVVSQFTLYGDVRRGNRPSFDQAALPDEAEALYEYFVRRLREAGITCKTGRFREMMEIELVNDGPVTILLDSEKVF